MQVDEAVGFARVKETRMILFEICEFSEYGWAKKVFGFRNSNLRYMTYFLLVIECDARFQVKAIVFVRLLTFVLLIFCPLLCLVVLRYLLASYMQADNHEAVSR